jgi:integrase
MPRSWAGRWKGGRYYVDPSGKQVFVIERRVAGQVRALTLETHDEDFAVGELARFEADPERYALAHDHPEVVERTGPVYITDDRIKLYLRSIAHTVDDHRAARKAYINAWGALGLDLKTVDLRRLRTALAGFDGGHRGRVEALNAFCRFLVREGDLPSWRPLRNTEKPDESLRAPREAYSLEQLKACYTKLQSQPVKDLFRLRAATGMHHTEIEQLEGCGVTTAPLPDKGVAIRTLKGEHEIAGVLQVMHKSRRRHRQPVDAPTLAAALRLRASVPSRIAVWEAIKPLVPSNLRHTFATLAGECGRLVTYTEGGVDRARVAQALGHRAGSTMTADRYEKIQVPPMIVLPLGF